MRKKDKIRYFELPFKEKLKSENLQGRIIWEIYHHIQIRKKKIIIYLNTKRTRIPKKFRLKKHYSYLS
jgi:hypothetical protein